MVKVTGPMLSQAAAGKLGQGLIFSVNKGRAYVKKHTAPKQTNSGKQIGMRSIFAFLSPQWASLSPAEQATWEPLAAKRNIAPCNAFQSLNTERFRDNWAPSKEYPAAAILAPTSVPFTVLTANVRSITVNLFPAGGTPNWGFCIFRKLAAVPSADYWNAVAAIEANGFAQVTYLDTPLKAGTYHYRAIGFTVDGSFTATNNTPNATIT